MSDNLYALRELSVGEAAGTAIFGYCVVFVGLVLLMIVLYCTGAYFKSKDAKAEAAAKAALENTAKEVEANPLKVIPAEAPKAPGSAGHVKLHGVPDKEAAMIMAIVADQMQKPINELHFISIKEVK
ncbi:OadG family protein [Ruminococcus sp. XPD3002]|uniref:OadG family protein n=1 Tax=Ruminococcus sp. XPD3002 TaxID=1452269 RepID=UPI000920A990|nr:OadG family protein [Ruminococcus sp.]SFX55888.1 Oxaloacetate decarboxylase, gamma chain [Ruminococcus flavefaciens]HPY85972.1 OadG family protein [Ruminococcus flavefaciens]HRU96401.1 OadG family protein [Ruminococcus sp.]